MRHLLNTALLACALIGGSGRANAQAVRLTSARTPREVGQHLYREKVEIYWNDWRGVRTSDGSLGSADVYVEGSGKTAQFDGVVSFNCQNGKHYWKVASQTEPDIYVPRGAIDAARRAFCRNP